MGRPVGVAFVMNMSQWQATGTGYALTAAIPASSRNNLSAGYSSRRSSVTTMRVDFKNSDGPYDTPRDARGRPRPPAIAGWQRQPGRRAFPKNLFVICRRPRKYTRSEPGHTCGAWTSTCVSARLRTSWHAGMPPVGSEGQPTENFQSNSQLVNIFFTKKTVK